MAKPPARWQKRHSSTRAEAKILQALFLAVMLILSVPLDLFNIDWLLAERDEASSPKELRRFLLNHDVGEDALDVGLDNVWKRQLRAQEEGGKKSMAGDMQRRMAVIPRYADKHHFDECVGKTVSECQILIDSYVTAHPDDFNDQTTLLLDIRKMREWTDDSYYKVVLRTNTDGTEVYGIFDDGQVYYPWPWRVEGEDKVIGPWDCSGDGITYLSPAECCQLIQSDVVWQDDNQHYLACFVEEPVGGVHNPEREDRAIVVIDAGGEVVRAPVAH